MPTAARPCTKAHCSAKAAQPNVCQSLSKKENCPWKLMVTGAADAGGARRANTAVASTTLLPAIRVNHFEHDMTTAFLGGAHGTWMHGRDQRPELQSSSEKTESIPRADSALRCTLLAGYRSHPHPTARTKDER